MEGIAGGYDLEIGHLEVASMVTWWIVAVCTVFCSDVILLSPMCAGDESCWGYTSRTNFSYNKQNND